MHEKNPETKRVKIEIINPKALTLNELYGVSRDVNWDEGIIEIVMERAIKCEEPLKHWICFDGPVDAVWIESMNTVLDDNKKLCLSSGKVLLLTNDITMMFEVENLFEASPATVSRCGMVYMEPSNLNSRNLFKSYLEHQDPLFQKDSFEKPLLQLIEKICYPMLAFWSEFRDQIYENSENPIILGFIKLLDCFFKPYQKAPNESQIAELLKILPQIVTFVTIWSIGANLSIKNRTQFSNKIRQVSLSSPEGNVFEYNFDCQTKKWVLWEKEFEHFKIPENLFYHEIVIPTKDFARGMNLTKLLLLNGHHVMTPGPVGCGKTTNATKILSEYLDKNYTSISMTLSAQTQANQILDTVFAQIDKRKKGVFGPSNGRKCIFFVDELNMP